MLKRVSVNRAVENYLEDYSATQKEINEDFVYKKAAEMAVKMTDMSIESLKGMIMILPIENYHTMLPPNFKSFVEVSYLQEPRKPQKREHLTQVIYDNINGTECDLEIDIKCPECYQGEKVGGKCGDCNYSYIEMDLDDVWNNAHPELNAMFNKFFIGHNTILGSTQSSYSDMFQLARPGIKPYDFAKYHIPTCRNLGVESGEVVYKIEEDKLIMSFEKGWVLLSFLGAPLDDDGVPYIFDIEESYETIGFYIDEKMSWIDWRVHHKQEDLTAYRLAHAVRLKAQLGYKNKVSPFDVRVFWAKAKKTMHTRMGRPYDKVLLGQKHR